MADTYNQLQDYFQRLSRIQHAITFLQWDQHVMMPPGGNESRAKSIAELTSMYHELLISPTLAELLEDGKNLVQNDDEIVWSLKEMEREHLQAKCIPADLVKAISLAGSKCEHDWRQQRKDNEWPSFLINFKEVVNLCRQEAMARQAAAPDKHKTPYDALLDLYCTGDSSELIEQIFDKLESELPQLIEEIIENQVKTQLQFSGDFTTEQQIQLNRKLMDCLQFNFDAGRLDESMHPFSTGDVGDHRITTRFRTTDFLDALQATAHETGHASYEAGLPRDWQGLPIGNSRNMCIHESQSLLYEKQLFLSKPFLEYFTTFIHDLLPQTASITSQQIWEHCTCVQSSYIRVEADEATYPLHIILRFQIESKLINGQIEAEDIPEIWDDRMKKYLGLSTAGNYTDGCLQDIHWTDGTFGYFPSYTIGALNGAQLFNAIKNSVKNWEEKLMVGDITFIRDWLQGNIWSKASSLDSQEILQQATGEGTNPKWFIKHLRERYLADR